jgi:hypothetical protein
MTKKTLLQTTNDPGAIQDWIINQTKRVPTKSLKDCEVSLSHTVRNKLFTDLGVCGGESPTLFGIPVKLLNNSSLDVTLTIKD